MNTQPSERPLHQLEALTTILEMPGRPLPPELPARRNTTAGNLLFDFCHAGVVLRVVVFIEVALAVTAMFVAHGALNWFMNVSVWTAGALPASLMWLVVACASKKVLAQAALWLQILAGVVLGMTCGLLAVHGLSYLRLIGEVPAVAGACGGALSAVVLMSDLYSRARRRDITAAKARFAELQSRIRPHFLFNTINTAIALIRESPRQAEQVLEDLAELFRHVLQNNREVSTLGEELDLARRYLQIEQLRFGKRLRLHWQVDDSAAQAKIPHLVLQPLVENTIRHGVEPSASGAEVWVSTVSRGSSVVIRVRNTLPGGQGKSGNRLALTNVRERLMLMHDVQCRFRSGLIAPGIFEVRIQIPLEEDAGARKISKHGKEGRSVGNEAGRRRKAESDGARKHRRDA